MANFLGVTQSDLFENHEGVEHYYVDDDTLRISAFLKKYSSYRPLYKAVQKVSHDDVDFILKILERVTLSSDHQKDADAVSKNP